MEDVGRVDVLEAAKNLVDERLEVGIGQGLSGSWKIGQCGRNHGYSHLDIPDNCSQITLHQLFIKVDLVVGAGIAHNVHVVETCDVPVACMGVESAWELGGF